MRPTPIAVTLTSALALAACGGNEGPSAAISAECVDALQACTCTANADIAGEMTCRTPNLPPGARPAVFLCPAGTQYGTACPVPYGPTP